MTKNFIDEKGFHSQKSDESTSLKINHLSNDQEALAYVNANGNLLTASMAALTRYQYIEHNGSSQTVTGSTFLPVQINGTSDSVDGGLSLWNTTTNVFQPEEIGAVYTLRFSAEIEPIGGNPSIHLDFALSGSNLTASLPGHFRHHQSYELVIRTAAPHIHVLATYTVFTDEDLFVSGAQIYAISTGADLTMASASLLIKEG